MTAPVMTKKARLVSLVLLSGATIAAPPAKAQSDNYATPVGLYMGLGVGVNQPTDSTAHVQSSSGGSAPTVFGFGTGYNLLGALGYKWNPNIRTELEFDYRHSDADNVNGLAANGAQKVFSFSGNVLYDINLGSGLSPYVGGGIGVARNRWSNVNAGFNTANFDGADTKFQWQLIGGVSLRLTRATALFADYRYIGVGASRFNGSSGEVLRDHYDHSHNILAGVRFFF